MNQDNNTLGQVPQQGVVPQQGPVVPQQVGVVQPQVAVSGQAVQQPAVVPQAPAQASVVATEAPATTNSSVILCPKCGSEMKKDSRYCMKCGQLNYAHPDNESMKQYAWQSIKEGNYVSGANMSNKQPLSMGSSNSSSVSSTNPFKACLITNIILHSAIVVLPILLCLAVGAEIDIVGVVINLISAGLLFLFNYSLQAMYIKAGEPWWGAFVPFYCVYLLYKIALGNGWIFLTMLIPIVGPIVSLIMLYNLGTKFYKNGWLTLFFPFVMIPVIGLDKNSEYSLLARSETDTSVLTVDTSKKTQSEKKYGRKKAIIGLLTAVVFGAITYFLWPYILPLVEKIIELVNSLIG